MYPLHHACQNNQPELVISFLVNRYPEAVQEQDNFGMYPLHHACKQTQPETVSQSLIDNEQTANCTVVGA
jgi:ankyrin repeat protein